MTDHDRASPEPDDDAAERARAAVASVARAGDLQVQAVTTPVLSLDGDGLGIAERAPAAGTPAV